MQISVSALLFATVKRAQNSGQVANFRAEDFRTRDVQSEGALYRALEPPNSGPCSIE